MSRGAFFFVSEDFCFYLEGPSVKSYCSMDQILISCENMIINILKCVRCCYSGFFCDILSLNVKMYL